MPISRNSASMPNVRASSGMIGTMCRPMVLCRNNVLSNRTTARRVAPFEEVFRRRGVLRRTVKRHVGDDVVADRDVEARAKLPQFLFVQFFLLVRDVAALAGRPETGALDR